VVFFAVFLKNLAGSDCYPRVESRDSRRRRYDINKVIGGT
jgi:hypothetical protein